MMLKPAPARPSPDGIRSQVFGVERDASAMAWAICVIKFEGSVPNGSAGREHAEYIKFACLEGMIRVDALCIVMDMSDLSYHWGNSIEAAFDALRRHYYYEWQDIDMWTPVKVIVSEKSVGFRSLLPSEMVFDDLSSAIASCNKDLERWSAD